VEIPPIPFPRKARRAAGTLTINRSWQLLSFLPFNFNLQSDGADGSNEKNVGERDARQGPAQRALQSCSHVMVSRHTRIPFASLNLPGRGRKWAARPNPGGFRRLFYSGAR
jgi:hypothetical protein